MTLNEFIGRAVAFFDRAEGAANAELAVLKARVAEVEKLLADNQYEYVSRELLESGKMVGGWLKSA